MIMPWWNKAKTQKNKNRFVVILWLFFSYYFIKFDGVYSKDNLHKIKDGAYVANLDECESVGTHWIALYVNSCNLIYFDSFWVEYITKEIKKFIDNKNIVTNIYRIPACDSIMYRYFCIELIDYMLKGKSLLEYINLFSPNKYIKNDKLILTFF